VVVVVPFFNTELQSVCFTNSHMISLRGCAMFALLYSVLTFQFPMFIVFLVCISGLFGSRASSRLLLFGLPSLRRRQCQCWWAFSMWFIHCRFCNNLAGEDFRDSPNTPIYRWRVGMSAPSNTPSSLQPRSQGLLLFSTPSFKGESPGHEVSPPWYDHYHLFHNCLISICLVRS